MGSKKARRGYFWIVLILIDLSSTITNKLMKTWELRSFWGGRKRGSTKTRWCCVIRRTSNFESQTPSPRRHREHGQLVESVESCANFTWPQRRGACSSEYAGRYQAGSPGLHRRRSASFAGLAYRAYLRACASRGRIPSSSRSRPRKGRRGGEMESDRRQSCFFPEGKRTDIQVLRRCPTRYRRATELNSSRGAPEVVCIPRDRQAPLP